MRRVGAVHPEKKFSDKILSQWALDIDRMNRLDGVPWGEIQRAVDWLYGPNLEADFSFVVQSGVALRAKYGRVRASMGAIKKAKPKPRPFTGPSMEKERLQEHQRWHTDAADKDPNCEWCRGET